MKIKYVYIVWDTITNGNSSEEFWVIKIRSEHRQVKNSATKRVPCWFWSGVPYRGLEIVNHFNCSQVTKFAPKGFVVFLIPYHVLELRALISNIFLRLFLSYFRYFTSAYLLFDLVLWHIWMKRTTDKWSNSLAFFN